MRSVYSLAARRAALLASDAVIFILNFALHATGPAIERVDEDHVIVRVGLVEQDRLERRGGLLVTPPSVGRL